MLEKASRFCIARRWSPGSDGRPGVELFCNLTKMQFHWDARVASLRTGFLPPGWFWQSRAFPELAELGTVSASVFNLAGHCRVPQQGC